MSTKARITSEFATQGEVASRLRIPATRTAELRRQLFELHVTQPDGSVVVQMKSETRGKTRKGNASARTKKK
jgi:hypothetical protein